MLIFCALNCSFNDKLTCVKLPPGSKVFYVLFPFITHENSQKAITAIFKYTCPIKSGVKFSRPIISSVTCIFSSWFEFFVVVVFVVLNIFGHGYIYVMTVFFPWSTVNLQVHVLHLNTCAPENILSTLLVRDISR